MAGVTRTGLVALGQHHDTVVAASWPGFPTCRGLGLVPAAGGLGHNRLLQPAAGWGPSFQQLVEIYWWPLKGGSQEAWASPPGTPEPFTQHQGI